MALSLYQVALTVLADVRDGIATSGYPLGPDARIGVVNGEIAWDGCDVCGQLVITWGQLYLSEAFPASAATTPQGQCAAPWLAADYALQIVRCAPVQGADNSPPSVQDLDASAQQLYSDAAVLITAGACSLADMVLAGSIDDYVVKTVVPVGPLGGCIANELSFTTARIR